MGRSSWSGEVCVGEVHGLVVQVLLVFVRRITARARETVPPAAKAPQLLVADLVYAGLAGVNILGRPHRHVQGQRKEVTQKTLRESLASVVLSSKEQNGPTAKSGWTLRGRIVRFDLLASGADDGRSCDDLRWV